MHRRVSGNRLLVFLGRHSCRSISDRGRYIRAKLHDTLLCGFIGHWGWRVCDRDAKIQWLGCFNRVLPAPTRRGGACADGAGSRVCRVHGRGCHLGGVAVNVGCAKRRRGSERWLYRRWCLLNSKRCQLLLASQQKLIVQNTANRRAGEIIRLIVKVFAVARRMLVKGVQMI